MSTSTIIYRQLIGYLRQHSRYRDLRHLKALGWMVSALICSGQLSLAVWEPYVPSRAQKAQSTERRWQRFMSNSRIRVSRLYLPLVMIALSGWQSHRLYLALDTTVLWERYCMIHLSVVCCGRAVPLLWRVLEHRSAAVAFKEYEGLLRQARWLLRQHPDVMLLADRGFANHELMGCLRTSGWHYAIRIPCDVLLHGARRYPISQLAPCILRSEKPACIVVLDCGPMGLIAAIGVLATVKGAKESWAVITDEAPSLQTLWQYALRFRVEELLME